MNNGDELASGFYCGEFSPPSYGLTKRERFAGLAMQGLAVGCSGLIGSEFTTYAKGSCNAAIAERAVLLADYLLAELAKPKEATNV